MFTFNEKERDTVGPQSHQVVPGVLPRVVAQSEGHPGPVEVQQVDPVLGPGDTATPVEVERPDAQPLRLEHLADGLGLAGVQEGVVAVLHCKVQQGSVAGQLISQLGL